VPNLYLVFTPKVTVTRKGFLKGYVPDPNNQYILDNTFSVA
jgi:hypothetical protein